MTIARPSAHLSTDADKICSKYHPSPTGSPPGWLHPRLVPYREPFLRAVNQHHSAVFNRRAKCLGCWDISTRAHHTLDPSSSIVPLLLVTPVKLIPKPRGSADTFVDCGCGSAQNTCRVCRKPIPSPQHCIKLGVGPKEWLSG